MPTTQKLESKRDTNEDKDGELQPMCRVTHHAGRSFPSGHRDRVDSMELGWPGTKARAHFGNELKAGVRNSREVRDTEYSMGKC